MEAMRWRSGCALIGVLLACSAQGCASSPFRRGLPPHPPIGWTIPEASVDTMFARDNMVAEHPRMSGPYPVGLVLIAFRPAATPRQRRAAIDAVRGRVVGGDGAHWFVRVETACADIPVWCAVDVLEKLPQVEAAYPFMMGGKSAGPS